ncbi:hypothetical protein CsatB_015916 [Cannabis sativa]
MMMKSLMVVFVVVMVTMVNNMGLLCHGTRVAHSVTIIPSSNDECRIENQYCSALPWQAKYCCEGLTCVGFLSSDNKCVKDSSCRPRVGDGCALLSPCCYPNHCSGTTRGSKCLGPGKTSSISIPSSILSLDHVDE